MKTLYLLFSIFGLLTLMNYTSFGQVYCIPPESTYGGPLTGFTNVHLSTLNNNSAHDGYTNYTSTVATVVLQKGSSYTPSFVLYYDMLNQGFTNTMNLRIWIDFNIDGDFEDAGEQVLSMLTAPVTTTTNIIITGTPFLIPAGATVGTTRMRVFSDMPVSDGHDNPIPCGYLYSTNTLGQHGETEDYKVTISTSTGIDEITNSNKFNIFSNNEGNLIINYNLVKSAHIDLEINNIMGQCISKLVSQNQNIGQYEYLINKNELNKGVYIVTYKINDKVFTQKIVL